MRDLNITWLIRRHMPDVLAIEQDSFPCPWSEDDFLRALRERNCIALVASLQNVIVGYVIYELHLRSIHVLNLAVAREHRRQGVGRALMEKLKGKLTSQRRSQIVLECPDWNTRAHVFYRACGLRAVSIEREHYVQDGADAYRFEYRHGVAGTSGVAAGAST